MSSSTLSIVNKWALVAGLSPDALQILQFGFSAIVALLIGFVGLAQVDHLEVSRAIHFLPAVVLFYAGCFSNMKLLQCVNVDTFVVIRTMTPLTTLFIEILLAQSSSSVSPHCSGGALWPQLARVASLLMLCLGAAGFSSSLDASQISQDSIVWGSIYLAVMSINFAAVKRIVHESNLSPWGLVLYNNSLAVLFQCGYTLIVTGMPSIDMNSINILLTWSSATPLLVSCVIGVMISWFGFQARKALPPTSYAVLGVVCKFATVAINQAVWQLATTGLRANLCMALVLVGGYCYQRATSALEALVSNEHSGDEPVRYQSCTRGGYACRIVALASILVGGWQVMHLPAVAKHFPTLSAPPSLTTITRDSSAHARARTFPNAYRLHNTRRLLAEYTKLHSEMMHPTTPLSQKRFYVAGTYSSNTGNRAMALLSHLLLAMRTRRALVFDGWLGPEIEFPLNLDFRSLPPSLLKELREKWNCTTSCSGYQRWQSIEQAYCMDMVPHGEEALFVASRRAGFRSPFITGAAANAHQGAWFDEHVGPYGLRMIMQWFFRPSRQIMPELLLLERRLCGERPCDIGVHIRRGRRRYDLYFPTHQDKHYHGLPGNETTELMQFAACANSVARVHRLPRNLTVFVASDTTNAIKLVEGALAPGVVRWNAGISQRPNGHQDDVSNSQQTRSAMLDLLMLSRTRYFIGTRTSTFSYLAAGMHPSATGHHWMVHPGVFERCVRASSPYSSLAQSERRFITTPSFSILGVRRTGFALPVCRPCRLSDMLTARVQS